MLIDTHAHLNFPDYKKDLGQVVRRSVEAGVGKIICASSDLEKSKEAIRIARKYPGVVYASVGIHPQQTDPEANLSLKEQIGVLSKLAYEKEVVAIGECGLDYSPAPPGEKNRLREDQFFLFREQIKIGQKLNLPIIVHTRKAFDDTVQIISDRQSATSDQLYGVFHCYSAGKKGIGKVLPTGFFFGVDGNLTYDEGLQRVFYSIPLDRILLETDCPYLSPEPFRGQRNEPKNVRLIGECLAKVKGILFEKVAEQTSKNAINLFNLN